MSVARRCLLQSLQPKLFARPQQTDHFTKTLLLRFLALGRIDPAYVISFARGGQLFKELPGAGMGLQFQLHIRRESRHRGSGSVAVAVCRRPLESGRCQEALCLEFRIPAAIDRRPTAIGLASSEFPRVSVFVQTPHQTVDPAEAQSLVDRVPKVDRLLARL